MPKRCDSVSQEDIAAESGDRESHNLAAFIHVEVDYCLESFGVGFPISS